MELIDVLDDWSNVPWSNVNDDGKPNLNNSNATNDNKARLAMRQSLHNTLAPATDLPAGVGELGLEFKDIGLVS